MPVARAVTSGAAATAGFTGKARPEDVTDRAPRAVGGHALDAVARANRLAQAWEDQDPDELAALAAADSKAALAGYVLAAAAATRSGDPRAFGYLQHAFVDGRHPENEPLLGPYLKQITFHLAAADLGLSEELPCSRTAIGCALACAERAAGDAESAYSVLLELPEAPVVAALRARTALDLKWPGRALRSAQAAGSGSGPGRFEALLLTLEGMAHIACGSPGAAVPVLTGALTKLDGDSDMAGIPVLRELALFQRAMAKAATDDGEGAWDDLTALLAANPEHRDASLALKSL